MSPTPDEPQPKLVVAMIISPGNTKDGDTLEVDLSKGLIKNLTKGAEFKAKPYPGFMAEIIADGGLIEHTKKRISRRRA